MNLCFTRAKIACKFGFNEIGESQQTEPGGSFTHCDAYGNCFSNHSSFNGTLIVECNHAPASTSPVAGQ